jgi:hypothetical protein
MTQPGHRQCCARHTGVRTGVLPRPCYRGIAHLSGGERLLGQRHLFNLRLLVDGEFVMLVVGAALRKSTTLVKTA